MPDKIIKLKYATLELTELWDAKIIIGEVKFGQSSRDEIKDALRDAGYLHGIQLNCIDAVSKGSSEQAPVALATVEDEAVDLFYHFESDLEPEQIEEWLKNGPMDVPELPDPARKFDQLLSFTQPPQTVLIYPNGKREVLGQKHNCTVELFQGKNTSIDEGSATLISDIEGSVHRDLYGRVSVYEVKTFPNIGRVHGLIGEECAVHVQRDVTIGSHIDIPSNLMVDGLIRGSLVEIEGNLKAKHGLDNSRKTDKAQIRAGQSIFTSLIQGYDAWAGCNIIVTKLIDKSRIECLDTIVVPEIRQSEIRVRKNLFVNNITRNSLIYLGPVYTSDSSFTARRNIHTQHAKRIDDIETYLQEQKLTLSSERDKALAYLGKLNRVSKESIPSDVLLNRMHHNLAQGIKLFDQRIGDYKDALHVYEKETFQINYYKRNTDTTHLSQIRVLGRIEEGTKIISPGKVLKIDETIENVRFTLDVFTSELNMERLS